ncbi:hypothetical protein CDAR_208501 [Caerostris darwini]|uniref:Uncharacterized protein n=1 Tax=Caerostris darwini TaxID=1538125 RepID=A0AAV4W7T9_9ARAC|nr:hypothetical protein CDAR_208501 [Caerostris darwini]
MIIPMESIQIDSMRGRGLQQSTRTALYSVEVLLALGGSLNILCDMATGQVIEAPRYDNEDEFFPSGSSSSAGHLLRESSSMRCLDW